MKVINKSIVIIIVLAISLSTCVDQPEPFNPCKGVILDTLSAEYDYIENTELYPQDSILKWYKNLDTLIADNTILLFAKDTTANYYLWQVNNDKVYTTTSHNFNFYFGSDVRGPIRLKLTTLKSKKMNPCLRTDLDSIKTFSRVITFIARDQFKFPGTWVGHYLGDKEITEVIIYRDEDINLSDYNRLRIKNFPKGCFLDDLNDWGDGKTKTFFMGFTNPGTSIPYCNYITYNKDYELKGRLITNDQIMFESRTTSFIGHRKK